VNWRKIIGTAVGQLKGMCSLEGEDFSEMEDKEKGWNR